MAEGRKSMETALFHTTHTSYDIFPVVEIELMNIIFQAIISGDDLSFMRT